MGMSKEKFIALEDSIQHMTGVQLQRLAFFPLLEWMSSDSALDDFLCESQADEPHIYQPVNDINELIPF